MMPVRPKVPDLIELRSVGGEWSLVVDGEPFPYVTIDGSVRATPTTISQFPGIEMTLIAKRITVDHGVPSMSATVTVYDNAGVAVAHTEAKA